jgi:hypothetical protein
MAKAVQITCLYVTGNEFNPRYHTHTHTHTQQLNSANSGIQSKHKSIAFLQCNPKKKEIKKSTFITASKRMKILRNHPRR